MFHLSAHIVCSISGLITRLSNGIPSPARVNFKAPRPALSPSSNITWYKAPPQNLAYIINSFFKAKVGLSRISNMTWHKQAVTHNGWHTILDGDCDCGHTILGRGDQIFQSNAEFKTRQHLMKFKYRQRDGPTSRRWQRMKNIASPYLHHHHQQPAPHNRNLH